MNILFVCTGNTCRSAMAEAIFNSVTEDGTGSGKPFSAASAGIFAFDGDSASGNAVSVLFNDMEIDISAHRSRQINKEIADRADIILTMTREHKRTMIQMFPETADRVYVLKEYIKKEYIKKEDIKKEDINNGMKSPGINDYDYSLDITDPYGMPIRVYQKCAEEIKDAIDKLVLILLKKF